MQNNNVKFKIAFIFVIIFFGFFGWVGSSRAILFMENFEDEKFSARGWYDNM